MFLTPSLRRLALLTLLAAPACSADESAVPTSPSPSPTTTSPFSQESKGGKFHNVEIANFTSMNDVGSLFEAAASDTGKALQGLSADDFNVVSTYEEITPAGRTLSHLRLRQEVRGVPVWGSHMSMSLTEVDKHGAARLLSSSHHVYSNINVNTVASLSETKAIELATAAVRNPGNVVESELYLWPLDGSLELVYSVRFDKSDIRGLVYASGRFEGRVVSIDERHYETTGNVSGAVAVDGAPGGKGVVTTLPLARANVTGADGVATSTDVDGNYVIEAADGSVLTAALTGVAATVVDTTGIATSVEGTAGAVTDLVYGDAADVLTVANATAYYYIDQTQAFLAANGFDQPSLLNLSTNVNINNSCNAFYSPAEVSINFYQAGGDCNNTSEASIIMHEYGHFVDDKLGGITNGGLSEGWGDLLACLILEAPGVGVDFFADPTQGPLRTCDNDYQFPASGSDSVHSLGQAWAGFGWHAREGLIAALGEEEGSALARALILPSFPSNAADIPAAVREVFLRDDDDGDIENKTPHWDILLAAADLHSLGFIAEEDLIAPSAITDLAGSATATNVVLKWTAVGDDGDEGTADSYDIRYSSNEITADNFGQALSIVGPTPLEAGNSQTFDASIVPGATVYFAIRTSDEQGNVSPISNVIVVTAEEGIVTYEDSFEDEETSWEGTGLWHVSTRKASDGVNGFWYGQEATGNYDTGAANAGSLLSPVIDLSGALNPILIWDTQQAVESGTVYDKMTITVFDVNDEAVSVQLAEANGNTNEQFVASVLALQGMADRQVRVRFDFDTVDGIANATEGWFVDNVRVVTEGEVEPEVGSLVINEVLADPGSFDANNDGKVSWRNDEFVELVNDGNTDLDLSGVTVSDSLRVRYTFPEGTVLPVASSVVVFGGGTANIGTLAFVAKGLGLNNTGDVVTVRAADGATLSTMSYGSEGNKNVSLNREVDGDANSPFVGHNLLSTAPASPGTRADGTGYDGEEPSLPAVLLINEVLADPGSSVDANGDGVVSNSEDEFVEIVNLGDESIDLSGASISDAVGVRVTLPEGTVLEGGAALVVFGGGNPDPDLFAGVTVVTGSGSLYLNNSGDSVTVATAAGQVLASAVVGASNGTSQTRLKDLGVGSVFVPHNLVSDAAASPGFRIDGDSF